MRGLRYDHYDEFVRVTPRAALIVLPSPAHSLKYLYGSAFRAPNEFELNTTYFGDGVRALRPESIDTHELVYEGYANDRLRTSVSTYWYKADRLITPTVDETAFFGASYVNQGQVRAKGLELEAQLRIKGDARALVSYAYQRAVDQQTGEGLPNSPHHVAQARISVPWPTRQSSVSVEGQFLGSRFTVRGLRVSPAGDRQHSLRPAARTLLEAHRRRSESLQRRVHGSGVSGAPAGCGGAERSDRADRPAVETVDAVRR